MFVYLLPSNDGSRFKIGKANDLHQRIATLGGTQCFQMDKSLSIQLKTERDAYQVERILHRTFRHSSLPPDPGARYEGDTEQFNINCFERVVRFLIENQDLFETTVPIRIPMPVRAVLAPVESKEERREQATKRRKDRLISEISQIKARNAWNLNTLTRLIDDLNAGLIKGGRLQNASFVVLTGHSEEQITNLIQISLNTLSGSSGPFPSCRQSRAIAFVTIVDDYLSRYGREEPWLSRHAGENFQFIVDAQNEIAHDAERIRRVVGEIPLISESEVLQIIRSSGEFEEQCPDSVAVIRTRIFQTIVDNFEDSNLMFSASLGEKNGIEYWRLRFWQRSLHKLGLSDIEIESVTAEEHASAQQEFTKRILALAKKVFSKKAHNWLHSPEGWLQEQTPISLMSHEKGLVRVWHVLNLYSQE